MRQDGPEPDILRMLRGAIDGAHGPDHCQGLSPEVGNGWGPAPSGWLNWQNDLRTAMWQYPPSNQVEREEIAALPPMGGWMPESEARARREESPGYGMDPAPGSLPLVRIGQGADLEDREIPCSMDTVEWESSEGVGEPRVEPSAAGRQRKGYLSSTTEPRNRDRRTMGSGTPAAHHREELPLLEETRRQAVRFLGRGRVGPPHW